MYNNYSYPSPPAQQTSPVLVGIDLAIIVLVIVSMWRIFQKAGQPGWKAIIPFYNIYIFLKIIGRPGWWLILLLIPIVNIIFAIIIALDLAKAFGKSGVFGFFLLFLLSFIGYPILAFGSAQYVGPSAGNGTPSVPQPTPPSATPPPQTPPPAAPPAV